MQETDIHGQAAVLTVPDNLSLSKRRSLQKLIGQSAVIGTAEIKIERIACAAFDKGGVPDAVFFGAAASGNPARIQD